MFGIGLATKPGFATLANGILPHSCRGNNHRKSAGIHARQESS